jgi:transcription initiation factor TFIIIB Brf1 subunit/transcription initiation factor TFIIB
LFFCDKISIINGNAKKTNLFRIIVVEPKKNIDIAFGMIINMNSKHSQKTKAIESTLIAPCGMNCRLCRAYRREKKACPGCYGNDNLKSKSSVMCRILNCEMVKIRKLTFCFECEKYPCAELNHLDMRYRTKYSMSMIDNLESIKQFGTRNFIKQERERWACPNCGEIICVHKENCMSCGYQWR